MSRHQAFARFTLTAVSLALLSACGPQMQPQMGLQPAPGVRQLNAVPQSAGANVPGQIIVKYRQGMVGTSAQMTTALSQMGAQRLRPLGSSASSMDLVQIAAGQSTEAAAQQLAQNPMIEFAEPVFTIPFPQTQTEPVRLMNDAEPAAYPNDPMFGRQYAHGIANSQAGWQAGKGNPRMLIGIVDSGVDVNHPDLKGKIVGVYNGADNNRDVEDVVGHGTHVAGIAAAATHNAIGVAGVAPECGILAVKVSSGTSTSPSTAGIANGIIWAADNGARVINLSLGSRRESAAITEAVRYALSKDIVVVAASGNDSGRIMSYPAATQGVIAVGSTDNSDSRSRFSNYGPWISVTAPGSSILSTMPFNRNMMGATEYGSASGTSMASPFVAGLVGLIRSQYPNMPANVVRQVLESTADDRGTPGFDEEFGHGRVNVGSAIRRAAEMDSAR
ncbi:MAG: S8 family serine peptidase [Candidatus Sericytochromatia bacterium]|nr:S8 family serine peptidase [Candidatus Sericytochromatia bacterium]